MRGVDAILSVAEGTDMEPDLHLLIEVVNLAQVLEADRGRQEPWQ